jgi:hypothetical protein
MTEPLLALIEVSVAHVTIWHSFSKSVVKVPWQKLEPRISISDFLMTKILTFGH